MDKRKTLNSRAAAILGSVSTEKKAATSAENGKKGGSSKRWFVLRQLSTTPHGRKMQHTEWLAWECTGRALPGVMRLNSDGGLWEVSAWLPVAVSDEMAELREYKGTDTYPVSLRDLELMGYPVEQLRQ